MMKILLSFNKEDELTPFQSASIDLLGEMVKYKTMWLLRSFETDINDEGGQIIALISNSIAPSFTLNGFSENLENQIRSILDNSNFMVWEKP